jgi:hypothetical protein
MCAMPTSGLPELDIARVQRWCAEQVPEHARDEVRIECDVAPRHLTISECRPPRREDFGPDWTRFPIARLHYTKSPGYGRCTGAIATLNTTATNPWPLAPESKTYSTTLMNGPTPSSGGNNSRLLSAYRCADRLSSRTFAGTALPRSVRAIGAQVPACWRPQATARSR